MKLLPFDYAARNAGRSPLRTILTTVGAAAVVFLVILMGAFVQTLGSTLRGTGEADNAIVLGLGSEDFLEQSEIGFGVPLELAASVEEIAKQTTTETPLISPEIHHAAVVRRTENEVVDARSSRNVMVRGITPMAFLLHRQVFITDGHAPGMGEVLAGKLTATKLGFPPDALKTGASIYFEGKTWKVCGTFESPGTTFESEIWAPLDDLKIQSKRDTLTCAVVRLTSPDMFPDLEVFTKTRLDLEIAAVPETTYYGALASFYRPMQILGWIMAGLVVASGLFGGLNTMIAAIASRSRELACLETIGFSRRAILVSLLQESLLQVGMGALIAAGLALALLAGRAVRVTMGALALDVGGPVLAAGFAAALFLAVFGTLIPAIRLARKPLVEMLRG
ncbi:MAG: ABC transporter permease [Candidatus Sumerlaeaceae bacterium]